MGRNPLTGPAPRYPVEVEILLWLVPPATVTVLAMMWTLWAGRDRSRADADDSEAAYERFAEALQKPHPTRGKAVRPAATGGASGVAVRRSRPLPDARPRR